MTLTQCSSLVCKLSEEGEGKKSTGLLVFRIDGVAFLSIFLPGMANMSLWVAAKKKRELVPLPEENKKCRAEAARLDV